MFTDSMDLKLISNLIDNLHGIIERDKLREIPVFNYVKEDFLYKLAGKIIKNPNKPITIGITGESAAGKSTMVRSIAYEIKHIEERFPKNILTFVSADNYFCDISEQIKTYGSFDRFLENTSYNPDAPTSFQLDLMREDMGKLINKENIYIPEYKVNGSGVSVPNSIYIESSSIIIAEGIAVLYDEIHDIFDVKFYVEVDEDIRKERYVKRAVEKRNQTEEDALAQFEKINKSAEQYLKPCKKYADVILNGATTKEALINIVDEIFSVVYKAGVSL